MKHFINQIFAHFLARFKYHIPEVTSFVLLFFLMGSTSLPASNNQGIPFDPSYEIRLNDREGGFYYHERIVSTTEGYVLEMGFELHDNKLGNRFGCEQMNRMIFSDLLDSGVFGDEGFNNPEVSEEEFMVAYKSAFLKYADNVRPYRDLRGFGESLQIWFSRHCGMQNRLESNPEWFLNLPEERLVLNNSGMPRRKSYNSDILGMNLNTIKEVFYDEESISFRVISELHDDITATSGIDIPVYDPFQINMIVSSFSYEDGFEKDLVFMDFYVEVPFDESGDDLPNTEIYPVEAKLKVNGSMFFPVEGEEIEVWVVDITGLTTSLYHPLLHLYDFYHRRFETLRYYIDKDSGDILMAETLTASGRPVSGFHVD